MRGTGAFVGFLVWSLLFFFVSRCHIDEGSIIPAVAVATAVRSVPKAEAEGDVGPAALRLVKPH